MTKERPDNPTLVIDIVRVTEWIIYPLELNKDLGHRRICLYSGISVSGVDRDIGFDLEWES
jgi:hypothetical protein